MTQEEVLKIFEENNALLNGHFKLSSGLHSGQYLQCALVLQYPKLAEKFSKELAKIFSSKKIDVVVGPAMGGVTLAYEIARALGVRGIFTERQEGQVLLRRGFYIEKGQRVLIAEDVVTTGLSTNEVIEVIKRAGGEVVGVVSIIDRSNGKAIFGVPFQSLAKIDIQAYSEIDCPLCKKGIPVIKPGSRRG